MQILVDGEKTLVKGDSQKSILTQSPFKIPGSDVEITSPANQGKTTPKLRNPSIEAKLSSYQKKTEGMKLVKNNSTRSILSANRNIKLV